MGQFTVVCMGINHRELALLRFDDLEQNKIAPNRVTLKRWMEREDDPFPQPLHLGKNSIAWRAVEVADWLERCANVGRRETA